MTNDPMQGPQGSVPGIGAASSTPGARARQAAGSAGGAEFQALLERLQERTKELEETSQAVDDPGALAGAVETARASLEDALSLSDQLLEAYREARQAVDPVDSTTDHGPASQERAEEENR